MPPFRNYLCGSQTAEKTQMPIAAKERSRTMVNVEIS